MFVHLTLPTDSNKKKKKPLFTSKSPIEVVCEKLWKNLLGYNYKKKKSKVENMNEFLSISVCSHTTTTNLFWVFDFGVYFPFVIGFFFLWFAIKQHD